MKRSALWATMAAMALVLSLMVASIVGVSADTAGAGGVSLSFGEGLVEVAVPQGAVTGDVDITYTSLTVASLPAPAPEGTALGSNAFALGVTPATNFVRPVNITVAYSADDVIAGGDNYTNVKLYVFDPSFTAWLPLEATIRDIPGLTLTTQQTMLGTFAVFVTGAPPPTPEPTIEPTVEPTVVPPDPGDIAPGSAMMLGLAGAGFLLLVGGGFLFLRDPRRNKA